MGDSPDPRDDPGSSDPEDTEESELTESATPSDTSSDADEQSDRDVESEDSSSADSEEPEPAEADGEESTEADEDESTEAEEDELTDAEDVEPTDDGSDDLPEHLIPDDGEGGAEESADGEESDEGEDEGDSFGTPPESSFDSGEDWVEAMNSDEGGSDSTEGGPDDVPEDETAAIADPDSVASEPADTEFGESSDADPAVAEPIEAADLEGPSSDEEMPLAVHIEEMVRRLAIVLGIAGVVTLIAYPLSERLIEFLWQSYIPQPEVNRPHMYGPLEFILTKLKVAGLSGTIFGLPVFVYETYRFMKPGLYPHERRYYLASVPTSLLLAFVGVAFSHFVILPLTVLYFTTYTENAAIVAFGLRETFNLIILMMGYMAIIFQIPLFIMLAIMMGLVTREWMEDKRLLFWGGFGGLAFTFVTVDPTGMAPIIIAVTMIVLFEGTLALLRWTGN